MIWIILIAAAIVAGGAWFVSKSMAVRAAVLAAGVIGVGCYMLLGKPADPDEPLAQRLDELEQLARTNAESMSADQVMAILQKRALDAPEDPVPHKFMGDILAAAGRPQEAILAYQSALRRDPDHLESLKALADLSFKSSMQIDEATSVLYHRVFELDPADLRIGYMAGIGDWNAGRRDEAMALWSRLEAQVSAEDPRSQMFKALREAFAPESLGITTKTPTEPPAP